MKNKFLIVVGILICINSCRMPSDPLGEIKIIKRVDTIDTGGNCLDIDVDIEDSILVAAANHNGYFVYKINSKGGIVSDITEQKHVGVDEMDNSLGDNRAQSIVLSKIHDIAFVMDQYDHIWLYKYESGATQYSIPNYMEEDCYGGTWLSIAIDDQSDKIGIYTLLKHNAAEFMPYCISESNLGSIGTDQGCSDIAEYIATEYNDQTSCEAEEGYTWMYPGCQVGNYPQYSTSLVWKNLADPSSTSLDGEPDCEYIINQGTIAEKIYFDNGLLSMTYGELGVRVFKQTEFEVCLTDTGFIELKDSELCIENYNNSGDVDYKSCCENTACPDGMGECPWLEEGFGGVFSSAGGIIPQIHAEFDTPGEVEVIFSKGNTIFSGLKYSNGCVMSILDDDGNIINTNQFAIGYSVTGIHQNNGLLALAAGHDGILLYNLSGSNVSFMGKIESSYANAVKIAGDIIFAATEDGIEVIQIDFTQ